LGKDTKTRKSVVRVEQGEGVLDFYIGGNHGKPGTI